MKDITTITGALNPRSFECIINFLLRAGTATLFLWTWSLRETHIPRPADFFLGLALALGFFYFLSGGFRDIKTVPRGILFALILFVFSFMLAGIYGYIRYDLTFTANTIGLSLRLMAGIGLFILVYVFARKDPKLKKKMYLALAIPPALYSPFLFVPSLAKQFSLVEPAGGRFTGLTVDANPVGAFFFIGFALAFTRFWQYIAEGRWKERIVPLAAYGLLWMGLEMLLLWTFTRSYLIAMGTVVVMCPLLLSLYYKKGVLATLFSVFAAIILVGSIYFVSPHAIQEGLLPRIVQTFDTLSFWRELKPEIVPAIERGEINDWLRDNKDVRLEYVARHMANSYYINFFREDALSFFLGLGINYKEWFVIHIYKTQNWTAENILDVILYGGIGAVASLLLFAFFIVKKISGQYMRANKDADRLVVLLGPALALLGVTAASIFITFPVFSFYFWILLALALA